MLEHDPGPGHPERVGRLSAAHQTLSSLSGIEWRSPVAATPQQVCRVHTERYLALLESCRGRSVRLDPDTNVSPGSINAAFLAAGAAVGAVDAIMQGDIRRAYALVRPPGHHAEADRAMGFCLLNNIAIAAAHGIHAHGLRRVMIVDWDVHHGNGTQHIFEDRGDVFFYSSHRYGGGFFPMTGQAHERGRGAGAGCTLNVPLSLGDGDEALLAGLRDQLIPEADRFAPELILVSAGFDAHTSDPIGGLAVTAAGFAAATQLLIDMADRHAEGRIALILEGGYDLGGVAACVAATARTLGAT